MNTAKAIDKVKENFPFKNMIHQRDKMWWFKANGALRRAIVEGEINGFARPVVLTEYPKSGGSWLSQMLSAALEIPYPRNRFPHLQRQIIHGGYRKVNSNADTIVCWRDGIIGDWKNVFNKEACRIFNHYAGDELILLGYEPDHTWVKNLVP